MKSITEIKNFEGKKVLVRVDWDVPVEEGRVMDGERVGEGIETIEYITKNNGAAVLIAHFGRKGESMEPVYRYFSKNFSGVLGPVVFIKDPFSHEGKEKINALKAGEVVVIENIRKWPEEEKNDESFAKVLSSLGEIFVNDSFATAHRAHASVVGIPNFIPAYAGFHFKKEVEELSKAFNPKHPFLVILGGAKLETKLPLIEKFIDIADSIFLGGILAAEAMKTKAELMKDQKILTPKGDLKELDVYEDTLQILRDEAEKAKFILWNGPIGNYENGYVFGTQGLAKILVDVSERNSAHIIIGGGDTLAAIKKLDLQRKFTHISTAGGAMLEFLANGTLPGIEALK